MDKINQKNQFKLSKREDEPDISQSRHLWVGNICATVTESSLLQKFSNFGIIENLTLYSSRNYAFINFNREEDACNAKKALHGVVIGGLSVRIEFAKGAKPSEHLWVGGICTPVLKEKIEEELRKLGTVKKIQFFPDKNCFLLDFLNIEDAIFACEALKKKRIGDDDIQVEYRSCQIPVNQDASFESVFEKNADSIDSQILSGDMETKGKKKEIQEMRKTSKKSKEDISRGPSEVLYIGFPLYLNLTESSFWEAFSPYGTIEAIRTFRGKPYAFVKFPSVREASRAKEALQGTLFNDSRVSITFARSEAGSSDQARENRKPNLIPQTVPSISYPSFSREGINPRNDRYLALKSTIEDKSESEVMQCKSSNNGFNSSILMMNPKQKHCQRELEAQMEPNLSPHAGHEKKAFLQDEFRSEKVERSGFPIIGDTFPWDEDFHHREAKRQKVGNGNFYTKDYQMPWRFEGVDACCPVVDLKSSARSPMHECWPIEKAFKQSFQFMNPLPSYAQCEELLKCEFAKKGWKWHGTIAKSGTSICQVGCSAMSKDFDITFPNVINCTARTSLETLAMQINRALSMNVVSFVPCEKSDIGPYQDFVAYLTDKKRAAVCSLSDECTLFLVPPSESLEEILNVPQTGHVIGVILHFHISASRICSEPPPESHLVNGTLKLGSPIVNKTISNVILIPTQTPEIRQTSKSTSSLIPAEQKNHMSHEKATIHLNPLSSSNRDNNNNRLGFETWRPSLQQEQRICVLSTETSEPPPLETGLNLLHRDSLKGTDNTPMSQALKEDGNDNIPKFEEANRPFPIVNKVLSNSVLKPTQNPDISPTSKSISSLILVEQKNHTSYEKAATHLNPISSFNRDNNNNSPSSSLAVGFQTWGPPPQQEHMMCVPSTEKSETPLIEKGLHFLFQDSLKGTNNKHMSQALKEDGNEDIPQLEEAYNRPFASSSGSTLGFDTKPLQRSLLEVHSFQKIDLQVKQQPPIEGGETLPNCKALEDQRRFQATLQLAAALLQQLQQRTN